VFDLAFDASDSLPAADLLNAVSAAAPGVIESVFVFDEYRGPGVAPARKGLAIRFTLRARDRTLSSGEIDQHRQAIIKAAEAIGAGLRKS
jgi:phenylalanyl-tRNA synthetase beta chain